MPEARKKAHVTAWIPLVLLTLFLSLGMILPTLRVHRRWGTWPVVFQRQARPSQRLVGASFTACIATYVVWALAFGVLGPERLGVRSGVPALGWSASLAGFVLLVAAQATMGASWRIGIDDRATALVTHGPFALVRNPIFSAMLSQLAGLVLLWPSVFTATAWVATAALIGLQVRQEEQHLLRLHGTAYASYAARVGRFVPYLGRLG